jgi:Cu2+-exporting ATPase
MKTSVIEVRDMLSVLSVSGVEVRIGEVPGVESVTVNYSAGSATVRYDETRLDVSDIKSNVRQHAPEADASTGSSAKLGESVQPAAHTPHAMPPPAASEPAPGKPAVADAISTGAAPRNEMEPTTASAPPPDHAMGAPDAGESAPKG